METQIERAIDNTSPSPVGAELYSLVNAVDSEFIADNIEIVTYTVRHDCDNHLKVGIFEGIHSSDSLDELTEKTDTHGELAYVTASTFSRLTNDRDYRAVVRLFFESLHSPQLNLQVVSNASELSGLIEALWRLTLRISHSLGRLLFQARALTPRSCVRFNPVRKDCTSILPHALTATPSIRLA